jgi:FkbM family methyltransferase
MRKANPPNDATILDIGLHNGEDSAYYLHLGYSVVGVDANPLLTSHCAERFKNEISDGRMKIVNAGVLKQPGEFIFYRNLQDDGWSSFVQDKGKKRGECEEMRIPCVTAQQLIEQHGKPYFMKVDIEGADFQAIESISSATAPSYVSLELSSVDPIIERLIDLGYSSFKFVDGQNYRSTPPIYEDQIGWRLLRKMGHVAPLVHRTVCKLPSQLRAKQEFNPPGKHSPDGYEFKSYSSGPFGEQAAGSWIEPKDALRWFSRLLNHYRQAGVEDQLWWDVHARHSSVAQAR